MKLDGKVDALEAELAAMHEAADAGDLHEQVVHDVNFHRLIVEAAGNAILLDVWKFLRVESRTIVTALRTGLDGHEIAERHRPVLDALRERDPERAGAALRRHLEEFAEYVRERN